MLRFTSRYWLVLLSLSLFTVHGVARAEEMRVGGKLALTGGVTSVEGAAGGGLATWSLIGGDETESGIGGGANATVVPLPDFTLTSFGAKLGIRDRIELSYQHQRFDTGATGVKLGLTRGFTFGQDIVAAKLRVAGDALYAQNSMLPQIAVGIQHKRATQGAVLAAVGAAQRTGTDFTLSATKILLRQSLLIDVTARATKANQFGLLGFGGDRGNTYRIQGEGSAALLLSPTLAAGAEYRTKPSNLSFAREDNAFDAFIAWRPKRHLTVTVAYADLGSIATFHRQRGTFLSIQGAF